MRLTEDQKRTVLNDCIPGAELIRVNDQWAAICHDHEQPVASRWRGRLVKCVCAPSLRLASLTGDVSDVVWWSGSELFGRTRRAVVEQLHAEAS